MNRFLARSVALCVTVFVMLSLSLGTAEAQSRRSRHGKSAQTSTKKAKKTSKKRRGRAAAAAESETTDTAAAGESERTVPASRNAITDRSEGVAGGREVTEAGGEKVKVMEFTGLDVSGRLKSPQILYFLNRMRAEFDRPRLDHRSFMPELVRSAKEKSF